MTDFNYTDFCRVAPCPDCGKFVKLAYNRQEQRCSHCQKIARTERARIAAEKKRREKGIEKVKGQAFVCVDCNKESIRNSWRTIRCSICQPVFLLKSANERSWQKSREKGAKIRGAIYQCAHCSKDFALRGSRDKYCDECIVLQKKNALPHLKEYVERYTKEYMSNPKTRRIAMDNMNRWKRNKVKNDPLYAIVGRCRARINQVFRKKGYKKKSRTHEIIGCSHEFLFQHIESKFKDGMTWENRSEWHIDHIMPISMAKTEDEVIQLSHYTNLQPLWAADNLLKSNKVINHA